MKTPILVLLLWIAHLSLISQTIIRKSSLPIIVDRDTLVIETSVWIETEESEIRQRGREKKLRAKLNGVRDILNRKKYKEEAIDSLINEMSILTAEKDSLAKVLDTITKELIDEFEDKLLEKSDKIQSLSIALSEERERVDKLNKKLRICYAVIIAETVLLILIL